MSAFPGKVLLATDGSEDAALAARVATDISKGTGSELHVVHVLQRFPRYAYPGVTPEAYSYLVSKDYEVARHLLDDGVERIEDGGGRVAETHTRRGPAADEILDLAEEIGAGLVLVGSRGLGPVKRLVMGSVSEGVVHHACCPVLVVRGGQGAWPPTRMVVGDDGSEDAKGAGELSAVIGKLFGNRMLVVRTYPEPPMPLELPEYEQDLYYRLIEDTRRREEKALEDRANGLSELLGMRPQLKLAMDDPASAILEAAGEEESVLVAVGSRGLGAVRRGLLGSVSTKVLRAAGGSVLIYPHLTEKKRSDRA